MLNELQNAVNVQDTSVFLIKYKNILEEMNNLEWDKWGTELFCLISKIWKFNKNKNTLEYS